MKIHIYVEHSRVQHKERIKYRTNFLNNKKNIIFFNELGKLGVSVQ